MNPAPQAGAPGQQIGLFHRKIRGVFQSTLQLLEFHYLVFEFTNPLSSASSSLLLNPSRVIFSAVKISK